MVVAEPRRQFIGRDAGNLVADPVEAKGRAVDDVLGVLGIDLIEIGVSRRQPPARIELPVGGKFHAAMLRPRRVEGEARIGGTGLGRLSYEFILEEFIES